MTKNEGDGAILFSNDATGAMWQFGRLPPRDGAFVLIGWTLKDNDGAVAVPVVNTLARGLVGFGRVTLPCSAVSAQRGSRWIAHGADYVGAFPFRAARGWRDALEGLFKPAELILLSTTREDAVRGVFDDPVYPWWHQGQFALLSRPSTILPDLAPRSALLGQLIEPEWADTLNELSRGGVEAIVRPGVDGSVVGVHCRSPETRSEVEESIRCAALDFGLNCRVLSEDAFALLLASSRKGSPDPG